MKLLAAPLVDSYFSLIMMSIDQNILEINPLPVNMENMVSSE
jgi:hypothetical protein